MVTQVAVRKVELVPYGRLAGCCAEVSSELLDEQGQILDGLIGFAFDVLGARYLDVRVLPAGDAPGSQLPVAPTGSRIVAPNQAHPRPVQRPHKLASIQL
jgi:hypothetical protein